MNTINKSYNIYNQGAKVYSDTQAQTQPTTTKQTVAQPAQQQKVEPAKTLATSTQSDKVSISDSGRAAVAQDKATQASSATNTTSTNSATTAAQNKDLDRFISGFTKSGHTKEQAINAYNLYASLANQQNIRT
jgi:fatty acid/phospholipid biosynthesis enzyme